MPKYDVQTVKIYLNDLISLHLNYNNLIVKIKNIIIIFFHIYYFGNFTQTMVMLSLLFSYALLISYFTNILIKLLD
jgi:hypothetical protein